MRSSAQAIENLLRLHVDSSAWVEEYDTSGMISPYLAGSFSVYRAEMLSAEVFFAQPNDAIEGIRPLRKRLDQLSSALGIPHNQTAVLYTDSLPTGIRRTLLENGIPFATAEGDIYIPFLSFRIGRARQRPVQAARRFASSDQTVFLYGLYAQDAFTQQDVMQATGLSVASVSRALSNLVAAHALDYETAGKTGRMKKYHRANDRDYYQTGLELFGSAIHATAHTNAFPQDAQPLASGISALARKSDLLAPSKEALAVAPQRAQSITLTDPDPDHGYRYAIQILNYDPAPFASDGCVDPFTMLMTIPSAERSDERVRIALREALKGCTWYQD